MASIHTALHIPAIAEAKNNKQQKGIRFGSKKLNFVCRHDRVKEILYSVAQNHSPGSGHPVTIEQHRLQQWDVRRAPCVSWERRHRGWGWGHRPSQECLGCGLERWREAQERCTC